MIKALQAIFRDGLALKSKHGSKNIAFEKGISSRVTLLPKIDKIFGKSKISSAKIDVTALPFLEVDGKPVYEFIDITKLSNKIIFINNTIQPSTYNNSISQTYTPPPLHNPSSLLLPIRYYYESYELNREYFNKIKLDFSRLVLKHNYISNVGLTRIFKNGQCGRWYQKGGYSYQQLSEEERSQILINGYTVKELDYSAMHPNIICSWEGFQAPADFYQDVIYELEKEGYNQISRFAVKKSILTSINAKSLQDLSRAINLDKAEESKANIKRVEENRKTKPITYDELKRSNLKYQPIVDAFKRVYPNLSHYMFSQSANKLMLAESEIMTHVLLELKRLGIPSVPIHDSLLFPEQYTDQVKQVMIDCYKSITGFDIVVK